MDISNLVIFGISETVNLEFLYSQVPLWNVRPIIEIFPHVRYLFSANYMHDRMDIMVVNNVLFIIFYIKFQRTHVIFSSVSCAYMQLYASDRTRSHFSGRPGMYFIKKYIKINKFYMSFIFFKAIAAYLF